MYLRAKQTHPVYIQCLTDRIFLTHEDFTLHAHHGCNRCRCNTMLTGTGLCDHTCLTHTLCQKHLSKYIVDLVGTGVV